jgi:hypothetical protein
MSVFALQPNSEIIAFDFAAQSLSLDIETLPFLPKISVRGADLQWDAPTQSGT